MSVVMSANNVVNGDAEEHRAEQNGVASSNSAGSCKSFGELTPSDSFEENEALTKNSIKELMINNSKVRKGIILVSNGKSCPLPMRIYLTVDKLCLQRQELCHHGEQEKSPNENEIRIVKIIREAGTGFGLSIKGGSEHNLPIMISDIVKGQAADKTGKLFVGDAIIKVNGEMIVHCTHDEAVNILRNAGDLVMLTVKHYRAATPFLKGERAKLENDKAYESKESPEDRRNSVSSHNDLTLSRKWVDVIVVPLTMAYVTRYIQGTDKLRPNGFEVYGLNDIRSGIIYCDSPAILTQWLKYISHNISSLIQLEMRMHNRYCSASDRIEYMGWINEGVQVKGQKWNAYEMRFFAIKGTQVYFFQQPTMKLEDWSTCQTTYKLYTSLLRVVKETQTIDERQHCMLFNTAGQTARYFSVDTRQELLKMESAWNSATCASVKRLGSVSFGVSITGVKPVVSAELVIDWNNGYALYDTTHQTVIWKYRYSQLRSSSDDGKSKIKLHFRDDVTNGIETKELESPNLDGILYCMLAFMQSKVATVSPHCNKGL